MTGYQTVDVHVSIDPRMTRMLSRQNEFQTLLGRHPDGMSRNELKEYIRTQAFALMAEVVEATDETQWKPWAADIPDQPIVDKPRYVGELADVFIFFMNMMLAGKVSVTELCQAVDAKQDKNIKRQQDGYNAKDTKCPGCKRAYDDPGVNCTLFPCTPVHSDPDVGAGAAWCENLGFRMPDGAWMGRV